MTVSRSNPPQSGSNPQAHNAVWVSLVNFVAGVSLAAYAFWLYGDRPASLGWLTAWLVVGFSVLAGFSLLLSWRGRVTPSIALLIGGLLALIPSVTALVTNVGVLLGLSLMADVAVISGLTLVNAPRFPYRRAMILAGLGGGTLTLTIDLGWPIVATYLPYTRLTPPAEFAQIILPASLGLIGLFFTLLVARGFPQYRFSTKLIISFLLVTLAPLALVSLLNARNTQMLLTNSASRTLTEAAEHTAEELEAFVGANLNLVDAESHRAVFSDFLSLPADQRAADPLGAQAQEVLISIAGRPARDMPEFQNLQLIQEYLLLDQQGRVVLSTGANRFTRGQDLSVTDFFQAPMANGRPYVSPVYVRNNNRASLFFAARVTTSDQRRVGVLVAEMNLIWLQRLLDQNASVVGEAGVAALFDENDLRLVDTASQDIFRFTGLPTAERIEALRSAARLPDRTSVELNADLPELTQSLASARNTDAPVQFRGPINSAGKSAADFHLGFAHALRDRPWVVVVAIPERTIAAAAQSQTELIVIVALLVAAAVAVVSYIAARAFTQPVSRLIHVTERLTEGELTARAQAEASDEIGRLAQAFNTMTDRLQRTQADLELTVERRTAQLQATADIGRATAGIRNLGELLELAVELIRGRFGFYHASIFLISESGEYAVLRESTGEIGAQLKARRHQLAVGSRSLVGWVTQNRKPRIALDVLGDPFHFKNPLLPETRSELCLPLLVGERLIGALDVQSKEANAFSEVDVQTLQALADQLSVAIENAQLFQQTQSALAEARAQYQQTAQATWRTALTSQVSELVFDLEPGGAISEVPLTIPLRLRDEVIGVLELHGLPEGNRLREEELAVLETVTAQVSTALENAALYQDSQRRSRRDQLITEITDQIRASPNSSAILQGGLRQLGRALGATEVVVKLQPQAPESPPDPEGEAHGAPGQP